MERKLLSVVKKYPELYDREHSNYQQLKVNKALWDEVGKEMQTPGDECQVVWKRLKKDYLQSLNTRMSGAFSFFEYENEMEFLLPFYEDCTEAGYYPVCSDVEDTEDEVISISEDVDDNDDDDVISISEDESCNDSDIEDEDSEYSDSDNDSSGSDIEKGADESLHSTIIQFKDKRKLTKAMRRDIKDLENKYKHVDIKKLISLVEKEPPLYDIRRQDYHHYRGKKSTIWDKIARNMRCSAMECSKTWHIIRKFYFDYLDNNSCESKTCWLYEQDMTFLYPIYLEKVQRAKTLIETQIEKVPTPFDCERRLELERRVIEAVKNYPALYNTTHTDFFRYRNNKDCFWDKVAQHTNATVDECRKSWTYLKKCYLQKLDREFETKNPMIWRFKNEMSFLKPIYAYKRKLVNHIDLSAVPQNDERRDLERNLVLAIQKYPPLFDIRLPEFVNLRGRKGLLWAKVSAETNCPVDECRKIWRTLLTCYCQFLKRRSSVKTNWNKWRLEKEMAYLEPVYNGTYHPAFITDVTNKEDNKADRLKFKIIHTVRKYPVLYDIKHPDFLNTRTKNIPIWMKIGKEIGCPGEQCRQIWNDLRKMYISYEKRRIAGARVTPWKFADAMSFYDLLIGEHGKIARKYDMKRGEIIYRDDRRDFERQLIELVKNCPKLYDYSREDYVVTTDITQRKLLWSEIGKKLNATGQECSTSWRNLKKFYVNSIQRPVPGESPLGRKWKFKEEMKFLLPLYKNKRTYSRVRIESTDDSSLNMSFNEYTSDETSSNVIVKQEPYELMAHDEHSFGENFLQNFDGFEDYAGIYVKAEYTDAESLLPELSADYNMRSIKNEEPAADEYDSMQHDNYMYLINNLKNESNME